MEKRSFSVKHWYRWCFRIYARRWRRTLIRVTIQRAKICPFFYCLIDIAQWWGCFCPKHPRVLYCENSSGVLGTTTKDFIKRCCVKNFAQLKKKKKDFVGFYGPLWGHGARIYVKNTPAFRLNHKLSDETNEWNSSISRPAWSVAKIFSPHYLGSMSAHYQNLYRKFMGSEVLKL